MMTMPMPDAAERRRILERAVAVTAQGRALLDQLDKTQSAVGRTTTADRWDRVRIPSELFAVSRRVGFSALQPYQRDFEV